MRKLLYPGAALIILVISVVDLLLAHGASVNVRRSRDKMTALGLAKSMKHPLVVERLKQAGAIE